MNFVVDTFFQQWAVEASVEGVDTQAQLGVIRAEGFDEAQGYLFARPLPAKQVLAVIERTSRKAQMEAYEKARAWDRCLGCRFESALQSCNLVRSSSSRISPPRPRKSNSAVVTRRDDACRAADGNAAGGSYALTASAGN